MQSDEELVDAVLLGERQAYAHLVGRYERTVRAVAIQVLGDPHRAKDVAQDAFIKAYDRLGGLKDRRAFGPWLLSIARHAAIDQVQCDAKEIPAGAVGDLESKAPARPFDDDQHALFAAVSQLHDAEKQVIMLRFFGDHSVVEVAEIVGRSVGTVTKQLSRAYERLRGLLKEPAR